MRHDGGAQNTGCEKNGFRIGKHEVQRHDSRTNAPIGFIQNCFDQVADRYNPYQAGNDCFQWAEAALFET